MKTKVIVVSGVTASGKTTLVDKLHQMHSQSKVMKKSGMSFEGTLRQAGINNLGICDENSYSILRKEYDRKQS